jgi:NitT/TauT family transport system permease protein
MSNAIAKELKSTSTSSSFFDRFMVPIIALGIPLLMWEVLSRGGFISTFLFPAPTEIIGTLWSQRGWDDSHKSLYGHVYASLMRLLIGLGLATVLGTIIGILIGLTHWGRFLFQPIISMFMPVPTLAWTPILLLLIGIDNKTTILIVFIAASFEVILTVVAGIENMNVKQFWVARSMGASKSQIFFKVIIPGIFPYLITGVKLGSGYAWRALIAAEMLAASSFGLGFMIFEASEYMDMKTIYGGLFLIAIFGYFIENVLLGRLEKNTVGKWGVQVER